MLVLSLLFLCLVFYSFYCIIIPKTRKVCRCMRAEYGFGYCCCCMSFFYFLLLLLLLFLNIQMSAKGKTKAYKIGNDSYTKVRISFHLFSLFLSLSLEGTHRFSLCALISSAKLLFILLFLIYYSILFFSFHITRTCPIT